MQALGKKELRQEVFDDDTTTNNNNDEAKSS